MITFIFMGICFVNCAASSSTIKNSQADIIMLEKAYQQYKEEKLTHRRFKHRDVEALIQTHQKNGLLGVQEIGKSVQNRSIYKLSFGEGQKKIMLWSQMHGNEPTATMALFDLFNFLSGTNDGFDSIRNLIRQETSIHFIPMLNPDGAELYVRRNALDIDLNRDARATATPEGALLKKMADEFQPHYGFNLHDQNIYYNIPGTATPVTIALLAPAYNEARELNPGREKAVKIAAGMNHLLQQLIPNAVARYDDTYTPRGFGDNFQAWGTSTVLIESGGYKGDPEKQYIRALNFKMILNAFLEIATGAYEQHAVQDYEHIPLNDNKLFDVLVRGAKIPYGDGQYFLADIGINRDEITMDTTFAVRSRIADLGDLKDHFGYDEINEDGLEFVQGKVYPTLFRSAASISREKALELLQAGYIAAQINHLPPDFKSHEFPLLLFTQRRPTLEFPKTGRDASFFLAKDGQLKYAIVNGQLIRLND